MFQSGTTADDVIVCHVFVYMSQSGTTAAPCRCPSGVVRVSLAPRPTLSLSVLYHLSQNGTATAPVVVRGVQCCPCQSDNHPCPWSMLFVSKWDHGRPVIVCLMLSVPEWDHDRACRCPSCVVHISVVCPMQSVSKWDHDRPCRCLSGVVLIIPLLLSVPCNLSQSGTTTVPVVVHLVLSVSFPCYLSHAICLKVGTRPPLSLSVWCRPYHSTTVVCPLQSVSKWDHDRPCRCLSGVVRVRLAPRPFPSSPAPLHDHVTYLGAEARPAVVKSAISLRCFDVLD